MGLFTSSTLLILFFVSVALHAAPTGELPVPPWDEVHELLITSQDAKLLSEMKIDTRGIRIADIAAAGCAATLSLFPAGALSPAEEKYTAEITSLLTDDHLPHDTLELLRVQLTWIANVPEKPDTASLSKKLNEIARTLPSGDGVGDIHRALGEALRKARDYIQQIKNKVARGERSIYLIQDRLNFMKNLIARVEAQRDQLGASESQRVQYLNAVILRSLRDDVSSLENKKTVYELAMSLDQKLEVHAETTLATIEEHLNGH